MENGIIDLEAYLATPSFNRLKAHFYLYETLYTYNFEQFEKKLLTGPYGRKSHFEKVALFFEQGFIRSITYPDEKEYKEKFAKNESYIQIVGLLNSLQKEHLNAIINAVNKEGQPNYPFNIKEIQATGHSILALKERLYALSYKVFFNEILNPTLSLDCFNALELSTPKSDIYRVLISNIPIPDDSVPLIDIIQYREDESNKLRFLRLRSWVSKLSKQGLTEKEIVEEIETLIAEYKNEMKIAGMRMKNAKIEFAIKILPHLIENIVKLNFSKLMDPIIKLRYEKVSLLSAENKAKGNELSYIIRTES